MLSPASATENTKAGTACGDTAAGSWQLLKRVPRRQKMAVGTIVISSIVWICGFAFLGMLSPGLPWCISLAAGALASCFWLATHRPAIAFSFLPVRDHKPMTFMESCAGTYVFLSVTLCCWMLLNLFIKPEPQMVKPQVVDIELTSLNDYKDKHELLSGTRELPSLRKRTSSDVVDSQGSLTPSTPVPVPDQRSLQPPAPPSHPRAGQNKPETSPKLTNVRPMPAQPREQVVLMSQGQAAPSRAKNPAATIVEAPHVVPTPARMRPQSRESTGDNSPFMEEVQPPELVELVNNDGDQSTNIWQPGGHSAGGTGSQSDLASYLKELNKKIKSVWSPPRGESRRAEVVFRIQKSGRLVSIKLLRSSGDSDSDQAALQSIISCAPLPKLPADYPANYLDVCYTFNYRVDELSEVTGQQIR